MAILEDGLPERFNSSDLHITSFSYTSHLKLITTFFNVIQFKITSLSMMVIIYLSNMNAQCTQARNDIVVITIISF